MKSEPKGPKNVNRPTPPAAQRRQDSHAAGHSSPRRR